MARSSRLVLPGRAHLVQQRGHNGQPIVRDAVDAQRWVAMLRDVTAARRVVVHGGSLLWTEFRLLMTPLRAADLSSCLQDLGRRYVQPYNQRHGRTGTLWDGRFRCAVVQPGAWELASLAYVEVPEAVDTLWSSRGHHLGQHHEAWLGDPGSYWLLGNTPFERHAAWRAQLEQGLDQRRLEAIGRALGGGKPLGEVTWLRQLQLETARDLFPRPRGRPAKALTR